MKEQLVWSNGWDGRRFGVLRNGLFRDVEGIYCLKEVDWLKVCGRSFQMDSFSHAVYSPDSKLWLGWTFGDIDEQLTWKGQDFWVGSLQLGIKGIWPELHPMPRG